MSRLSVAPSLRFRAALGGVGVLLIAVCAAATPRYAVGFETAPHNLGTVLTVVRAWPGGPAHTYILADRTRGTTDAVPSGPVGRTTAPVVIVTPVRSAVVLSTTALAHIERLGRLEAVRAVDRLAYVYSPAVRSAVQGGRIAEVGEPPLLDLEKIIALNPDVVIASAVSADNPAFDRLRAAGIPVFLLGDWMEESPLGRAEWSTVLAHLFGNQRAAAQQFAEVADAYAHWKARAATAFGRPQVLINVPLGGRWPVGGADTHIARLIRDAGADYLWATHGGAQTVFLDYEVAYAAAARADVWINLGWNWTHARDVTAADPRLALLPPFRNGEMYNYTRRAIPNGGNDIWESGATRPDLVLADLIKIFHPELAHDHEFVYYRRLD